MKNMWFTIVKYKINSAEGELRIICKKDDTNEQILNKAKKILESKIGSLPEGFDGFEIIND